MKFSVKVSGLSVKLFIYQCTYFATLNIFQRLFDVPIGVVGEGGFEPLGYLEERDKGGGRKK